MDAASQWLPDVPKRDWCATNCLYFDAPAPPVTRPILVLNGNGCGAINNLHIASAVNAACAPAGRALVSVTVLEKMDDVDELVDTVRDELVSWFGDELNDWRHLKTFTIPKALPAQKPGVLDPPERPVRTESGVYVCGDHRDQASIQGAMVSGRRAAEAVLRDFSEAPWLPC
jgi:hypothetical protein